MSWSRRHGARSGKTSINYCGKKSLAVFPLGKMSILRKESVLRRWWAAKADDIEVVKTHHQIPNDVKRKSRETSITCNFGSRG